MKTYTAQLVEGQTEKALWHNLSECMKEYRLTGKIGELTPKDHKDAMSIGMTIAETKAYGTKRQAELMEQHKKNILTVHRQLSEIVSRLLYDTVNFRI